MGAGLRGHHEPGTVCRLQGGGGFEDSRLEIGGAGCDVHFDSCDVPTSSQTKERIGQGDDLLKKRIEVL